LQGPANPKAEVLFYGLKYLCDEYKTVEKLVEAPLPLRVTGTVGLPPSIHNDLEMVLLMKIIEFGGL
jgi:hypothetical protein